MQSSPSRSRYGKSETLPSTARPLDTNESSSRLSNGVGTSQQQPLEERNKALQEAEQVMESLSTSLDGFNLLGVVANPRGMHGGLPHAPYHASSPSLTSSSRHGGGSRHTAGAIGSTHSSPPATTLTGRPAQHRSTSSYDFAAESLHALESTLSQVTTQIDTMNSVLDGWSRHYLGSYETDETSYEPPSTVEQQLLELPPEMASLSLASVQTHLDESGALAQGFWTRSRERETWQWGETQTGDEILDSPLGEVDESGMGQLEASIPSLFFQPYLDLTDPTTFCELLVLDSSTEREETEPLEPSEDLSQLSPALAIPTRDILRLPPPESFSGWLDAVEIQLLQQVRSKSLAFFHETNRFGQLQEWISGLVSDVQRIRSMLQNVQAKSVVAWELIPLLDQQRQELLVLSNVLEGANEVLRCKATIGGLLSANDDGNAAEQIQYGRKLLDGTLEQEEDNDNSATEPIELGRLQALSTVGDQLSQYETLVVANLGDELIEIFLQWNTSPSSSFKSEDPPRVQEICKSLKLCGNLSKTGQLYGHRLNDVIRMTVRTTVGEFAEEGADTSVKVGVTSMNFERFLACLDMLFEQLLVLLESAVGVDEFCQKEAIRFCDESDQEGTNGEKSATAEALTSAAELSTKSISELLRLRKEAHSLVTVEEMKRLWDVCTGFTAQVEKLSSFKATGLRSTLLSQAKAFVERKHESNMSSLVAALDSERWMQCDVSAERQAALTRLCLGRAVWSTPNKRLGTGSDAAPQTSEKKTDAEVEGVRYKVVWSCLLLVEMLMTNMACAAHFQALATNVVGKVAELLRLFNSRSTQLVLGAGAINSAARLKSINAKHLSLVTQCLGMTISILPHVRASLMAQLPPKQHTLLNDLDKIKKEYVEHNEKVLNKFVTIIGGIVEHGLAPRISNTNFDDRVKSDVGLADGNIQCCVFLEGLATNTKKMHQVLNSLLPPDHLMDVFSRIFAYVDQKVPELFVAAAAGSVQGKPAVFSFPSTDAGKRRMLLEIESMTQSLNGLAGVRPWEFSMLALLERKLDYQLRPPVETETAPDELAGEGDQNDLSKLSGGGASARPEDGDTETTEESQETGGVPPTDEFPMSDEAPVTEDSPVNDNAPATDGDTEESQETSMVPPTDEFPMSEEAPIRVAVETAKDSPVAEDSSVSDDVPGFDGNSIEPAGTNGVERQDCAGDDEAAIETLPTVETPLIKENGGHEKTSSSDVEPEYKAMREGEDQAT